MGPPAVSGDADSKPHPGGISLGAIKPPLQAASYGPEQTNGQPSTVGDVADAIKVETPMIRLSVVLEGDVRAILYAIALLTLLLL